MVNQLIVEGDHSGQPYYCTEPILESKSHPCSSTILQTDPIPSKQNMNVTSTMCNVHDNDVTSNENDNQSCDARNNDFVIRDGFPALGLPGTQRRWNVSEPEPIPNSEFTVLSTFLHPRNSQESATMSEDDTWGLLHHDASTVFTARTRNDNAAYSVGTTYFCPCQMKPRCQLEEIVQSIFRMHTRHLPAGIIIPEQSGSEWWTLVMDTGTSNVSTKGNDRENDNNEEDDDDDVGMHFDADYGLEEQVPNLMLHPRLATVTYLTDFGTPTLVLDQRSPPQADTDKKTLEGCIRRGWLSHPIRGKHIAFDGRLLHGAPSTFFPQVTADSNGLTRKSVPRMEEPPSKKARTSDKGLTNDGLEQKRMTLLVNIWINHCPLDAEPLDDEIIEQLKLPFFGKDEKYQEENKGDEDPTSLFRWNAGLKSLIEVPKVSLKAAKLSSSPPPSLRSAFDCKDDEDDVTSGEEDDVEPAGEEEIVIGGRLITISYGATLRDFHNASVVAAQSKDSLRCVELELDREVIAVAVGEEVTEDEDSDNDSYS